MRQGPKPESDLNPGRNRQNDAEHQKRHGEIDRKGRPCGRYPGEVDRDGHAHGNRLIVDGKLNAPLGEQDAGAGRSGQLMVMDLSRGWIVHRRRDKVVSHSERERMSCFRSSPICQYSPESGSENRGSVGCCLNANWPFGSTSIPARSCLDELRGRPRPCGQYGAQTAA